MPKRIEHEVPTDAVPVTDPNQLAALLRAKENADFGVPLVSEDDADMLTEADIYDMPSLPTASNVSKTFVLNGKSKTIHITNAGAVDAEKFVELVTLIQGKRDAEGNKVPERVKILPPNGQPFTLTSSVYIAELRALAAVSKISFTSWAVLGKAIGAKGIKPGWHGMADIIAWAFDVNGMTSKRAEEDRKSAGEDERAEASPTG